MQHERERDERAAPSLGDFVRALAAQPRLGLIAAEAALRALDFGPILARRTVGQFRRHDEEILAEQAEHRDDIKKLITLSQRGRQDLEKLLTGEVAAGRRAL